MLSHFLRGNWYTKMHDYKIVYVYNYKKGWVRDTRGVPDDPRSEYYIHEPLLFLGSCVGTRVSTLDSIVFTVNSKLRSNMLCYQQITWHCS